MTVLKPRIQSQMLDVHDAARLIGCSTSAMAKWRMAGTGPTYVKMGKRRVAYMVSDLETWLLESRRQSVGG